MTNNRTLLFQRARVITMASFSAVIHKDNGYYVAKCPEVRTSSQGRSLNEALKNLKYAEPM